MTAIRNFLIYILFFAVLGAGGATLYGNAPLTHAQGQGSVLQPLPPPFPGVTRLRLVLIGADDRQERGRSDTLMVLNLNPSLQRATLLSIPRDLLVTIPASGEGAALWQAESHRTQDKVNHAYRFGGEDLSRQVVDELLGYQTDGYVKVNLEGFVKAVDILGGVNLDVEDAEGRGRGMNYDCPQDGLVIHLKPGMQHLTGYKAMGYVRYRKSNIIGKGATDFQRAARQQKFLKAMIAQKVRISKLPELIKAGQEIFRCVETNLSWREMLDLVRLIREMPAGGMKSFTLPVKDQPIGHTYYCGLKPDETQTMLQDSEGFLNGGGTGDPAEVAGTGAPCRVEVLNGSGIPGAAAAAADMLKATGFEIMRVGNAANQSQAMTTVLYRGQLTDQARHVQTTLGTGQLEHDTAAGAAPAGTAQVQVTLGKDFKATGRFTGRMSGNRG